FYREKNIPKQNKDGSFKLEKGIQIFRTINPSQGKLKLLQKRINRTIFQKLEYPPYVHGGLRGCDSISNAAKHKGKKFKFCVDYNDFFPSITNKHVFSALVKMQFSPTI